MSKEDQQQRVPVKDTNGGSVLLNTEYTFSADNSDVVYNMYQGRPHLKINFNGVPFKGEFKVLGNTSKDPVQVGSSYYIESSVNGAKMYVHVDTNGNGQLVLEHVDYAAKFIIRGEATDGYYLDHYEKVGKENLGTVGVSKVNNDTLCVERSQVKYTTPFTFHK